MKNRTIEMLALIFGLLTTIAGVLTLPQVAMLPKEWQPYVGLGLALVVVGKNGAYVILDFFDDGLLNKSYKLPVITALLCVLLIPACGTAPNGERTFAGATGGQWLGIGKGVLLREAPLVYGEVRDARELTSAKQPLDKVAP